MTQKILLDDFIISFPQSMSRKSRVCLCLGVPKVGSGTWPSASMNSLKPEKFRLLYGVMELREERDANLILEADFRVWGCG